MVLKETERTAIENLRTQEKSCIEKYQKYAQQAIDPELKNLFEQLHKKEQTHYDSLTQVLDGTYRQVTAMTVMEETMNQEQSIQQRASPKIRCMMHFLQLMQLEQRNWFPENIIQMYLCLGIVILES